MVDAVPDPSGACGSVLSGQPDPIVPRGAPAPVRHLDVLGIIPGSVVYTSVGAGLGEVFARGETPNLGIIFEPQIIFPIIGLCVLAALPIAINALRGKKGL